jgi:carbamoyl-phosphate synthase large subunit
MGGQTALNCALDLWKNGVLDKYKVELIGAKPEAIDKAEDRLKFKDAMTKIGLGSARSGIAHSMDEAWAVQKQMGFPPSSAPASRWAAPAAALPTTPKSSKPSASAVWRLRPPTSC